MPDFRLNAFVNLPGEYNDTPAPVVCGFYDWGAWVNGGAWLAANGHFHVLIRPDTWCANDTPWKYFLTSGSALVLESRHIVTVTDN